MVKILQPHFRIVCDLETSGSDPIRNGVLAACILVIDENFNVVDKFIRYVRPPDHTRKLWSLEGQGIHGMTFEQVENFMPNDQFCNELLWFLKPYKSDTPLEFICHASPNGWWDGFKKEWKIHPWFDYFFLEWCFRKAYFSPGREMVWTMFKVIHPQHLVSTVKMGRDAGYKKNRLNEWAERLNLKLDHHNAESDTLACLEVYKHLINQGQGDF